LNIPVVAGSPSLKAHIENGNSAASKLIAKESKRGGLAIMCGSPLPDLAHSLKFNGAFGGSITPYETRNTWNEKAGNGATEYVAARVKKVIETPINLLFAHLGKKGGNIKFLGKSPEKFIDDLRSNKAWDAANSPEILQANRNMNTFMNEFQDDHPVRWADFMHLGDFF